MTFRVITEYIVAGILIEFGLILVYDGIARVFGGYESTITAVIREGSAGRQAIPLLIGLVIGAILMHLFPD